MTYTESIALETDNPPTSTHSGANRKIVYLGVQPTPYTQYLLENLRKSDRFELEVIYTFRSRSDQPWKSKFVHSKDKFMNRRFGFDLEVIKRAFRDRGSMFYVLGYNEPTKFVVLLVRMVLGYPYSYFNDSIKLNKNFYHILKSLVLPVLLWNVHTIFTTGNFGVRRFRESGYAPRRSKIVDMPFFVPLPELQPASDVSDRLTFLCSGRLVDRKGFDDVLAALHRCKRDYAASFNLLIAGSGPKKAELERLIQTYDLQQEVSLLGWLEAEELELAIRRSDVFIHYVPILDPFPVAVLEAMAYGLPIIGSDQAGSVVDRVEHGVSGYVLEPQNVSLLAETIMRFVNEPERAAHMGRQARRVAEQWPVERAEEILENSLWW